MEEAILGFVRGLRGAGVRVSAPEAADALLAAGSIEIDDSAGFRSALRATLVKRDLDLEAFEELFPLHFSPFGAEAGDVPEAPGADIPLPPLPAEALDALGADLQGLLDRVMAAGDLELALLVREAGREALATLDSLLQQGMVGRAILEALGAGGADAALDRFAAALRAGGMAEVAARAWRDRLRDQLERLRATVRGVVRESSERVEAERRGARRAMGSRASPIGTVSPHEAAELRRLVDRLGRRLDSLPELRRRPGRRGGLDLQRTWRANLQCGAIPFRLRWKDPRPRRPQVVALCDISNSMQSTVRFMLHFLYRLQDRFSRVRTFVFVSDTVEVTAEFQEAAVDTAIARALEPAGIAYHSATKYGRSFERFLDAYPDAVGSRTILLVLGDGRSNHTPPRAQLLEQLGRRARRVVWLNPEARLSWGLGDSAMPAYLPFCTQASEVRTVAQLETAIEAMVSHGGRR